ncbi:Plant transposon protein [Fragilaria crotonensis]|nr:Plant transposon protein [Fragilaria crotonensis]
MEIASSDDDDDDDSLFDTVMIVCQEDFSDSSSDGEYEEGRALFNWGGSTQGRAANIERHRVFYSHLLFNDFWGPMPVYSHNYFKLFFKLPIKLFDEILVRVRQHDDYFCQKKDATGKIGLSTHQKVASAVRLLTSGVSSMEHDDKYRMAASTSLEGMKRFCVAVNELYEADALRHPTIDDINRLLDEGKDAGFPGCIGSIDCMHWEWKNCPSSWKGMFQGRSRRPTVVLEAIADHTCRFWHFNFGSPGSLNDINILDRSPLFHNAVKGEAPQVAYTVNGNHYRYAYWLADGIYSTYACFVKTFPRPATRMQKMFATAQEAKRKDIERAFGILQARFHILTSGCRLWNRDAMKTVIKTCVILHNLIIDFERVTTSIRRTLLVLNTFQHTLLP